MLCIFDATLFINAQLSAQNSNYTENEFKTTAFGARHINIAIGQFGLIPDNTSASYT